MRPEVLGATGAGRGLTAGSWATQVATQIQLLLEELWGLQSIWVPNPQGDHSRLVSVWSSTVACPLVS